MQNPNAFAAALTSTLSLILVWALHRFGVGLTSDQAVLIAGAATTAVLWIGRAGIAGAARRLWRGATVAAAGAPAKDPAPPE